MSWFNLMCEFESEQWLSMNLNFELELNYDSAELDLVDVTQHNLILNLSWTIMTQHNLMWHPQMSRDKWTIMVRLLLICWGMNQVGRYTKMLICTKLAIKLKFIVYKIGSPYWISVWTGLAITINRRNNQNKHKI